MTTRAPLAPLKASDFDSAFPHSRKVYIESRGVRVPMREISLGGGEPPLIVYDTSGPQGIDARDVARYGAGAIIGSPPEPRRRRP